VHGLASVDGQLTSLDEATIPVLDRGFLYGDAVFEALRTYQGKPHALDLHLERLFRSAALIGIHPGIDRAIFASEIERAIDQLQTSERYVRIVLTRGHGASFGLSPRAPGAARRVVIVRPLELPASSLYTQGAKLETVVSSVSRSTAGAKPTAYLSNLLALEEAEKRGAHEALLIGEYGQLLEGATSSVFLLHAGRLLTPPLALGILPGITRALTMAAARALDLACTEQLLTVHDAYRAQEIVITSSIREVVPVVMVDGVRIGSGTPGPIAARLLEAYRSRLSLD
jgi:branched-chain amino acid aminotransferase